jgi:hypothetical protein
MEPEEGRSRKTEVGPSTSPDRKKVIKVNSFPREEYKKVLNLPSIRI